MIASRTRAVIIVCAVVAGACAADQDDAINSVSRRSAFPSGRAPTAGNRAVEEINQTAGSRRPRARCSGRPDGTRARDRDRDQFRDEGKVVAVISLNSGATIAAADIYNHRSSIGSRPPQQARSSQGGQWTSCLPHRPPAGRASPTSPTAGSAAPGHDRLCERVRPRRLNAFAPAFDQQRHRRRTGPVRRGHGGRDDARSYLRRAILASADALVIGVGEVIDILRAARRLGAGAPSGARRTRGPQGRGPDRRRLHHLRVLPDRPTRPRRHSSAGSSTGSAKRPETAAHAYDRSCSSRVREVRTDRQALRDFIAGVGTVRPACERDRDDPVRQAGRRGRQGRGYRGDPGRSDRDRGPNGCVNGPAAAATGGSRPVRPRCPARPPGSGRRSDSARSIPPSPRCSLR